MKNKFFVNNCIKISFLVAVFNTTFLAAFAGGDTYSIFLNNKLIYSYRSADNAALKLKGITLNKTHAHDNIKVEYSHCGVQGISRSIAIKNGNTIKKWSFSNGEPMVIPVRELLNLENINGQSALYYSSKKYLPEGKKLVSISISNNETAMYKQVPNKLHYYVEIILPAYLAIIQLFV